jgi:hypothetical protein
MLMMVVMMMMVMVMMMINMCVNDDGFGVCGCPNDADKICCHMLGMMLVVVAGEPDVYILWFACPTS